MNLADVEELHNDLMAFAQVMRQAFERIKILEDEVAKLKSIDGGGA